MMTGTRTASTKKVGFLLIPRFSMIAMTSALEVLRMANKLSEAPIYEWSLLSVDGEPVEASNGISLSVDRGLTDNEDSDAIFVSAGLQVHVEGEASLLTWLKQYAATNRVVGGICTGSWLLAKAGLLDDSRSTIHWENIAAMREEFPHLIISPELFEIDGKRYTCAGGIAPMDMMLHEVRTSIGSDLANGIAEQYMLERIRDRNEKQKIPLTQRIGAAQPKLAEVVSLMEANIEEPISLDELSGHVGLSRRQLERLFQRYLRCVPTRYYLELRLERARQLLLQTSMPVVNVAQACGFTSAPHFSKCYRETYNVTPRDERRRASNLLREPAAQSEE